MSDVAAFVAQERQSVTVTPPVSGNLPCLYVSITWGVKINNIFNSARLKMNLLKFMLVYDTL